MSGAGAISGYVFTGTDDALPQVNVTVSNPAIGIHRTAVTSDDGFFEITSLPPAPGYKVKIELKGYTTFESPAFELAVGRTHVVTLGMQRTGQAAPKGETFRVEPHVDSNKLGITNWVTPEQVKSLPSSERVLDPLVVLSPLASFDAPTGRILFLGEAKANVALEDGIDITNGYFQNSTPGIAKPLTLEDTQEFQVLSATYPAEFGRALGGVVNAVTPAGPNIFHGGVFDYLRPSSFSSTERFSLGQKLLGQRNQVGGNLGGPIMANRVMFYANFEHLNDTFSGMNRITSQTLADSTGKLIPTSNCTAAATQCAAAIKFIQAQMNVVEPFKQTWNSALGRVDYRRNDVHSFNAEFNLMNQSAPDTAMSNIVAPNGGLLGLSNNSNDYRIGKGTWIWNIHSETINELNAGIFQDKWIDPQSNAGLTTGNVGITVAGVNVGNPNPSRESLNETRYQLVDTFTLTSGTHTLRLGGDVSRTHDTVDMLQSGGLYNYPNLSTFAIDLAGGATRNYTNFQQQFGASPNLVSYRELSAYAQDTWRGLPRINITFGVRWDKIFLPQPSYENSTFYQSGSIQSSNISFSPRVGLAYRISGDTVLRAGYGFFYLPYSGQFINDLLQGNGLSQTWVSSNPNATNAPFFPRVATFVTYPVGTSSLMYAQAKLRDPHAQEATLALEKRIARATTVTLSAINSRSTKLFTGSDQNLTLPVQTGTYSVDNSAGAQVSTYATSIWTNRNYNGYSPVWEVTNSGSSVYYAGNLEIRHQMSRGLSVQALYTWSHATGTQTGPLYAGAFPLTSNPGDFATDKGNLPTDQRHRGVLNLVWQPVLTHDNSAISRFVINGWQISGIASYTSGQPLTPTVLLSGNQFSGYTMDYFTSLNGTGGWNRVPFDQIGSLHTDNLHTVDARISRTLPFTERIRAVLSFEAINLLNTQRSTGINTIGYLATASLPVGLVNGPYHGILMPVQGVGSGNASSAYPDGTTARQLQIAVRFTF